MQQADEQSVLAMEDEYVAAEVAGNEATLRRLVDDRFAFNTSKGTMSTYVRRQGGWRMLALQMQQRATN